MAGIGKRSTLPLAGLLFVSYKAKATWYIRNAISSPPTGAKWNMYASSARPDTLGRSCIIPAPIAGGSFFWKIPALNSSRNGLDQSGGRYLILGL